jgi:hypothetical protein
MTKKQHDNSSIENIEKFIDEAVSEMDELYKNNPGFAEAVDAMLKKIGPPPGSSDGGDKKVKHTLH